MQVWESLVQDPAEVVETNQGMCHNVRPYRTERFTHFHSMRNH